MNFIFISPHIVMGGIETLMARMSKWLIDQGHEVSILCSSIDDEMYSAFSNPNIIHVIKNIDRWHIMSKKYINKKIKDVTLSPIDVIVAFSPRNLKTAVAIACSLSESCRIVAGVWGDIWYCNYKINSMKDIIKNPSNYLFHELMAPQSRLYMNQTVQNKIEESCGRKVPGVIWPLPVDGRRFMSTMRRPQRGNIVSVGRLSGMKEYNIGMIDIINRLRNEGLYVKWQVYGDGPYRNVMENKIYKLGLSNSIKLMGNISYNEMHHVLEDAWLFVGMGTAIVEAAFARVPSIAVVPFQEEPMTFGCFHELPGFNVGEMLSGRPKDFYILMKKVLCADDNAYNKLCDDCLERAKLFSIELRMKEFISILGNIKTIRWSNQLPIKYRVSLLFNALHRRLKFKKRFIQYAEFLNRLDANLTRSYPKTSILS
jgi:hypothetical protein